MCGHVTQQALGSAIGKSISKVGGVSWGRSSKHVFRRDGPRVSGVTHGDDFVVTRPTDRLTERTKLRGVYSTKKTSAMSVESIEGLTRRVALAQERSGASARSQTCRRARESCRGRTRQFGADSIQWVT